MDNHLSHELVEAIKDDPRFEALQVYITNEIFKLDTVQNLEGLSDKEAGQQAKVNALTIKKLLQIFDPFINPRNPRVPSIAEVKGAKGKYGL